MPTKRTVADIKANLLRPALTSHFEVEIAAPRNAEFIKFFKYNGVNYKQEQLNLLCSEATLPGSRLATLEINNDFTGVTERHAYRRVYDEGIDFTFYVDADNYLPIRFFETWIKFIVDESRGKQSDKNAGSKDPHYFYRARYVEEYVASGLKVIKFERDYRGQTLEYEFIRSFPTAVTSIPVSYDASSLLKCTVTMTYIRYILNQGSTEDVQQPNDQSSSRSPSGFGDPALEAAYNRANNPLQGNGFGDPKVEAGAQAALGGATGGYADPALERAYQAQFGNQEEITINSFR
jgi:hypothetical protein